MARNKRGRGDGQGRAPADEVRQNSDLKEFAKLVYLLTNDGYQVLNPQLTAVDRDRVADGLATKQQAIDDRASPGLGNLVGNTLGANPQKWFVDTRLGVDALCNEIRQAVESGRRRFLEPPPLHFANADKIASLCRKLRQRAARLDKSLSELGLDEFGHPLSDIPISLDEALRIAEELPGDLRELESIVSLDAPHGRGPSDVATDLLETRLATLKQKLVAASNIIHPNRDKLISVANESPKVPCPFTVGNTSYACPSIAALEEAQNLWFTLARELAFTPGDVRPDQALPLNPERVREPESFGIVRRAIINWLRRWDANTASNLCSLVAIERAAHGRQWGETAGTDNRLSEGGGNVASLLRSALDELKLRFRAAIDPDSPSKAWLLHVPAKGNERPPIYGLADGFDSSCAEPSPSDLAYRHDPAIGRRNPPFRRCVRLNGYQSLKVISQDAATLLEGLPDAVKTRLWHGLPAGTELKPGPALWVLAVFELGNANVVGSPLRCVRYYPLDEKPVSFNLPADADWYATLPDFAAASVQAIDILKGWLADEPKRETEGDSNKTPKRGRRKAKTDGRGRRLSEDDEDNRKAILRDWNKAHSAGLTAKEFCKRERERADGPSWLNEKALRKIVSWQSTRKRRLAKPR